MKICVNGYLALWTLYNLPFYYVDFYGKISSKTVAQQSVHPTLGILRQSQAVFYALAFFWLDGFAVPAPAQVTQTVSAPSEAWRFLQSASLCRTRSNQPFVPSVAVMKEKAKTGWRYTIVRENLGIEEGTTATSMSLETGIQISAVSDRTTSLKRTQGTT